MVWELLTHKIPFEDATTIFEICKKVVEEKEVSNFCGINLFPFTLDLGMIKNYFQYLKKNKTDELIQECLV